MTGSRLLIRTPSRLHFGLLGWGPGAKRQFGGLGLMIRSPDIEMTVEPAATQRVAGPLSDRVERILGTLRGQFAEIGIHPSPVAIRIHRAPVEHVGLGVGTQLSLAVATAVTKLNGLEEPTSEQLARLTGRGRRSGIGLHGFRLGGFLVDGGRKDESSVPPLLCRLAFPEEWSILLIQPPGRHGLHGPDEIRAFAALPPVADALTDRLCRLVLLAVLPAIAERDLRTFGQAIEELQSHVGSCFAPAQGGMYNSPYADAIIRELRQNGFHGCGQSSWGPSLYAFSERSAIEVAAAHARIVERLSVRQLAAVAAVADNRGATVEKLP
ncbi:MAG: beta-ribofuranosylaminobenzene 5'-phosphate synthase family protein [Isosphaeraceae bacterium]